MFGMHVIDLTLLVCYSEAFVSNQISNPGLPVLNMCMKSMLKILYLDNAAADQAVVLLY